MWLGGKLRSKAKGGVKRHHLVGDNPGSVLLGIQLIMHMFDSHSTLGVAGQGCLINSIPTALAVCLAQNRCFRKVCSGNKCLRLWIWCQANRIQVLLCHSLAVQLPTGNFSSRPQVHLEQLY